jgi:3D (Asp-Asp-Asp) domain-containing protein
VQPEATVVIGFSPRVSMYLSMTPRVPTPEPTVVVIPVKVTFYSSSPQEGTGMITASGAPVGPETAASRDLPFGTVINIHGMGRKVITDRGGGLGPNHIDSWVESREKAFALGVIYTTATILEAK